MWQRIGFPRNDRAMPIRHERRRVLIWATTAVFAVSSLPAAIAVPLGVLAAASARPPVGLAVGLPALFALFLATLPPRAYVPELTMVPTAIPALGKTSTATPPSSAPSRAARPTAAGARAPV